VRVERGLVRLVEDSLRLAGDAGQSGNLRIGQVRSNLRRGDVGVQVTGSSPCLG
jgi:hypothetical protein